MGGRCRLRWLSFLERPVIYFARDQADRLSIDRLAAYPCSRGNLWEPSEVLPSMRSLRIGASRLRAVPVAVLTALVAITLVPVPAALASSGPTSTGSAVRTAASQAGRVTSFAGLGEFKPLSTETFGEGTLSVNPARPGVVAWCAGGSVAVQGLHSETEVPTTATLKRIASWLAGRAGTQYRMSCQQVAVGASAGQVFASFVLWPDCTASHTPSVINASFGMYTADNGEAWSFVPLPKGAAESSFNVFNYGPGGTVQASFSPMPRGPFEVTADGGRRGSLMGPQAIRCPALGLRLSQLFAAFGELRRVQRTMGLAGRVARRWPQVVVPARSGRVPVIRDPGGALSRRGPPGQRRCRHCSRTCRGYDGSC